MPGIREASRLNVARRASEPCSQERQSKELIIIKEKKKKLLQSLRSFFLLSCGTAKCLSVAYWLLICVVGFPGGFHVDYI